VTPTKTYLLITIVSFALAVVATIIPGAQPITFVAVILSSIWGIKLWAQVKALGLDRWLRPQKENEVFVLYHTSSGVIRVYEAIETFDGLLKIKDAFGRLLHPRRATYLLFGRRVVHAIQGVGHTVPPKVAMMTNVLKDKGYKSLSEAAIKELGPNLEKLPEGKLKEEMKKIVMKEELSKEATEHGRE